MFLFKFFVKLLKFIFTKPIILFLIFAVALISSWYFQGGIFAAIFIGVILFFIFLCILAFSGNQAKQESDENKLETYIEYNEMGEQNIQSAVPTAIVTRSDGKNTEHVILSKHKKLPKKITYE